MRSIYREILDLLDRRVPFVVATVVKATGSVPGKQGAKMIVRADGSTLGTVGGAGLEERVKALAREALRRGRGGLERFDLAGWRPGGLDSLCGGTVEVALEVHRAMPHLLLAGGGHVAKALADVARGLDWSVSVVDSRAEYADAARFPGAEAVVVAGPEWFARADLSPFTHLYLLGHAHPLDTEILKHAIARFPGHIGVIGSEAKKTGMWEALRKAGVPDDALARVECPIGLPIGAESPAEIAIAIAGSIIEKEKRRA